MKPEGTVCVCVYVCVTVAGCGTVLLQRDVRVLFVCLVVVV